jgi:glucose-6-phosphate 1-dehydrogenase
MNLLRYVGGNYDEDATFEALRKALGDAKDPTHYLAIPPSMFSTVGQGLGKSGCSDGARVVIEKPSANCVRGYCRAPPAAPKDILRTHF